MIVTVGCVQSRITLLKDFLKPFPVLIYDHFVIHNGFNFKDGTSDLYTRVTEVIHRIKLFLCICPWSHGNIETALFSDNSILYITFSSILK